MSRGTGGFSSLNVYIIYSVFDHPKHSTHIIQIYLLFLLGQLLRQRRWNPGNKRPRRRWQPVHFGDRTAVPQPLFRIRRRQSPPARKDVRWSQTAHLQHRHRLLDDRLRIPRLVCHPSPADRVKRSVLLEPGQVYASVVQLHDVGVVVRCRGRVGLVAFPRRVPEARFYLKIRFDHERLRLTFCCGGRGFRPSTRCQSRCSQ